jgi:hypothetical protein
VSAFKSLAKDLVAWVATAGLGLSYGEWPKGYRRFVFVVGIQNSVLGLDRRCVFGYHI